MHENPAIIERMKKVIVKAWLAARDNLDYRLATAGLVFEQAMWMHERVYLPHDYRPGMNMPRLVMRTEVRDVSQPAEYAMYLKRHIEDSGVDWVNYTPVGDYTEASGIVHQLGFRKKAEISRQRQILRLDNYTIIYLDRVEGAEGFFLKIEADVVGDESVEALRKGLYRTLKRLGQKTFIVQTYADLMGEDPAQMQPYFLP